MAAFLLLFALASGLSQRASAQQSPKSLPNVLILGDSISIGYTPHVQKILADSANVFRPTNAKGRPENCAGTINGVKQIDRWLKSGNRKYAVIHFNFGLHDLKRVDPKTRKNSNDPANPRQSEPAEYEKQLTQIVNKLVKTKAKLIFATTTPVPPGGVKPHRSIEDPERYNQIARKIMQAHDIEINDLFAAVNPKQNELMRKANVHFTKQGSAFLGKQVAATILRRLPKK